MNSRSLKVYYNNEQIGSLIENHGKFYSFEYLPNAKYDLSLSLKRGDEPFNSKTVKAFFENLLPEGDILEIISKTHLVSKNNPFSLLNVIGEDCAGAITLAKDEINLNDTKIVFDKEKLIKFINKSKKGLPYYEKGMRLSIAGVQNKTTLFIDNNNNFYLPSYLHPSTHIIKFENSFSKNILINELFCTKLANTLNIETSKMSLENIEGNDYLLIKRFDRKVVNNKIMRIHMEDFAQITGTLSSNKYESEGGPSFKIITSLIKKFNKNPIKDILNLSKILVYNFLIGNNDYHSKNLSIIFEPFYKLTPFYDLLSTLVYDNLSLDMAMKINHKKESNNISRLDIELEFDSWGLNGKKLLDEILTDFDEIISNATKLLTEPCFYQHSLFLNKIIKIISKNFNLLKS